jgi:hypothetical protein
LHAGDLAPVPAAGADASAGACVDASVGGCWRVPVLVPVCGRWCWAWRAAAATTAIPAAATPPAKPANIIYRRRPVMALRWPTCTANSAQPRRLAGRGYLLGLWVDPTAAGWASCGLAAR